MRSKLSKISKPNKKSFSLTEEKALSLHKISLLIQEGLNFHNLGLLDNARAVYFNILELEPNHLDALQLLGIIESQKNQWSSAVDFFQKALLIQPTSVVFFNQGIALQELKLFEQALASYDRAIALQNNYVEAFYNKAILLKELNCLDDALVCYNKVIELRGDYAEAYCNRGNILEGQKRYLDALQDFRKAIDLKKDYAEFYINQGRVLWRLNFLIEALANYEKAIELEPGLGQAYFDKGVILGQLNQLVDAIESYGRAISIRPDFFIAINNRAGVLKQLGHLDEALISYSRAIQHCAYYDQAYSNRGVVLQELELFDDAVCNFITAITLKPDFADYYYNYGNILVEQGLTVEALNQYDLAIRLKIDYAECYNHRAILLQNSNLLDEALTSCVRAIEFEPGLAQAYFNRGVINEEIKQIETSINSYDRAILIKPDYSEAHYNKGVIFNYLGRLNEALRSYEQAIELRPDYALAHWNYALALLLCGNYEKGFKEYEWRWQAEQIRKGAGERTFSKPLWLGKESLTNKTILLYCEQGLGDTVQFCRYASLVAQLGARVLLEVQEPLVEILQNVEGVYLVLQKGGALPDFDFHCPLMSLPFVFKTSLTTIPYKESYLQVDKLKLKRWENKLGEKTRPRIGLVWSSVSPFKEDDKRSVSFKEMLTCLPTGIFDIICLQKQIKENDRAEFESSGLKFYGDELTDFSETAALVECMDLVIGTCTSVPHLSAALGKPTWIILQKIPDWRWMQDSSSSPWYPSVRLYRQESSGDWSGVFREVHVDLLKYQNIWSQSN